MQLNHVAVFLDDLDRSTLAPALGGWAAPARRISNQPAMVGGHPAQIAGRTRRIRTAQDAALSVWVEDFERGAPMGTIAGNAWHHVAVWCNDVAGTVRALEQQAYNAEVVGRGPNGEIATFAYISSGRGPRLELTDATIRPRQLAQFASEAQQTDNTSHAHHRAPFFPYEVVTVVENAGELERLKVCWQGVLGAAWGEVSENTVTVLADGVERKLQTRSVKTTGTSHITIIAPAPDSLPLLAPVGNGGWHHVGVRSDDLARDVESLEHTGFKTELCDCGEEGHPLSFAIMVAPEGTRIKLAKV
jgi:hypothetical protein